MEAHVFEKHCMTFLEGGDFSLCVLAYHIGSEHDFISEQFVETIANRP